MGSILLTLVCSYLAELPGNGAPYPLLIASERGLAMVEPEKGITWDMPIGGVHDVQVMENGHILTVRGFHEVVEIDPETKAVVWSYDAAKENGNDGKRVEVHAVQALPNDRFMIAESGPGRIIEIDRDGKILNEVKLKVDKPDPHRDTRLARKIANGNYLACHEGDGVLREYDGETGDVVWEYAVPLFDKSRADGHGPEAFGNQLFSAVRLPNGNTLIGTGNGHSVLEVTPEKEIVWELHQNDLPGITFAWITTLEVLPSGHYVIGNCHAGPGQPLLVAIDPKTKDVQWIFDEFDTFGNNTTNSAVMGVTGILR